MNKKIIVFSLILILIANLSLFSWGTPVQISDSTMNSNGTIAMSSNGNAIAAWTGGIVPNQEIQASFYNGISWSPFITISQTGMNNSSAQAAIDGLGNVVVVWEAMSGATKTILSAGLPIGGSWSSPVTLSTSSFNSLPALDMNASGAAVAVWLDGVNAMIQGAELTFGGSWSSPMNLSSAGRLVEPQVGVDTSGNAIVIWQDLGLGEIVAIRRAASIWGSPQVIVMNVSTSQVSLGVGTAGNAVVAWIETSFPKIQAIIFNSGVWDVNPMVISNAIASEFTAANFASDNFVVWRNLETGNIQASNYTSGMWSSSIDLSPNQDNDTPSISIDSLGNAFILWPDFTSGQVSALIFPTGGVPGLVQTISMIGNHNTAQVSASANMRATGVWKTTTNGSQVIQANIN